MAKSKKQKKKHWKAANEQRKYMFRDREKQSKSMESTVPAKEERCP